MQLPFRGMVVVVQTGLSGISIGVSEQFGSWQASMRGPGI